MYVSPAKRKARWLSVNVINRLVRAGIINQLGPDNLENLKKLAGEMTGAAGGVGGADDDDVPDLVSDAPKCM